MVNTVSSATNLFLADLSSLEQRINTVQSQITSGLKIQNVSDAPDQVGAVLQLKANIAQNDQMKVNLTAVQSEVNAAEGAINTAGTLMNRAIQIAAQGANSVTTFGARQQLASQVRDIITEMYGLANTKFEGRYVFSGQNDQIPPYASVDLTQANGVGAYQGSSLQRQVTSSDGSTLTYSLTAAQIFDSSSGSGTSVFQVLTSLYNDLNGNNISAVGADASALNTATGYLSAQQSQYGDYQNVVADGLTYQNQLDVQYQQQLSAIQDTDTVAAATALQQDEISMQAALQAQAALPKKSLFDYLG